MLGKRLEVGEGGEEAEEERDEELLNVKVGLRVKLCLYVFSDKNVGMKGRERRRRKIKGEVLEEKEEEDKQGEVPEELEEKEDVILQERRGLRGCGLQLDFCLYLL